VPLHVGPPVTYNVTVDAEGPVSVELTSPGEDDASQDWGTGTHFSRTFTILEEASIRISNPSSNDAVLFEVTTLAKPEAAYPSSYLPRSLPYVVPTVVGGVVLAGVGVTSLKRDASVLLGLRREKGFWTCFLLPALIALDAVTTYVSVRSWDLYIEANPVIVSLYQTGLWAVASFHLVTMALVGGLSFFMYGLLVRSGLPRASRLVVSTLFSIIFGAAGFLVVFSSLGLLRGLLPSVYEYTFHGLFLAVGFPVLLSPILATYLSTIIPGGSREHPGT